MAANSEIKRKIELWLCAQLASELPATTFVPAKGGDDDETGDPKDEAPLLPPYCFVECTEAKKTMPAEPTYEAEVAVTYVTHIDDTLATAHSLAVRQINDAIAELQRGWDPVQQLMVHGTDISSTDETEDSEKQSHGDVIFVSMGCSG